MYRKSNQKCLPCGFDIKAISDIYPNNQMFLCTFSLKARRKILPQPFWQSLQRCFSLTTVWDTFMRYVSYFTQNGKLLLNELLCCSMAFPVLPQTTLELKNLTSASRTLRVIAPTTPYFSIGLGEPFFFVLDHTASSFLIPVLVENYVIINRIKMLVAKRHARFPAIQIVILFCCCTQRIVTKPIRR